MTMAHLQQEKYSKIINMWIATNYKFILVTIIKMNQKNIINEIVPQGNLMVNNCITAWKKRRPCHIFLLLLYKYLLS